MPLTVSGLLATHAPSSVLLYFGREKILLRAHSPALIRGSRRRSESNTEVFIRLNRYGERLCRPGVKLGARCTRSGRFLQCTA